MKIQYIESSDPSEIVSNLQSLGVKAGHFNNGTYKLDADKMVPTALAGFFRATLRYPNLPLIIAVNSDVSMAGPLKQTEFEPQAQRAAKVAVPLAELFPNNQVIVMYYDDETPNALYEALAKAGMTRTLHKWGYGTDPKAGVIEGAELFESVFAFPLPFDEAPVCDAITRRAAQPDANIVVDDLRNGLITPQGGLLFDLPETLQKYRAQPDRSVSSLKMS